MALGAGKWSCCSCSHCFTWWNHCSLATDFACAKALKSKHCSCPCHEAWEVRACACPAAPSQREGSCSEAAFASPTVQHCPMLCRSLSASFGFQSFYLHPKTFWILCPRLPNWSSLSHYFPHQLYGSEFAPVLNSVQWEPERFVTRCPCRDHQILQLERHNVLK